MNTFEHTVSMMKTLPETDLIKIQTFTECLFRLREHELADKVCRFLKPMSRDDFIKNIETAEQEIIDGKYSRAEACGSPYSRQSRSAGTCG